MPKPASLRSLSSVKTWEEFADFVSQIDHIRFRRGWDAKRILAVADDIRSGKAKISDMPDVAGLRDKVAALIKHRGLIPERKGVLGKAKDLAEENLFDLGVEASRKGIERLAKILPEGKAAKFVESLSEARTKNLKLYDRFDDHVTNLRAMVSDAPGWAKHHSKKALVKGYSAVVDQTREILARMGVSGGGNGALRNALVSIRDTFQELYHAAGGDKLLEAVSGGAAAAVSKTRSAVDATLDALHTPLINVDRLSRSQMREAVFSHGIGAGKVTRMDGREVFRLVDAEGKFLRDPLGKFMDFDVLPSFRSDKTAIVAKNGKYGMIDRSGEKLIDYEFDSLQEFGSARKIAKKDGEFFLLEKDASGNWGRPSDKSYAFMTEPQEGVSIAIRQDEKGKMVRDIVRDDGTSVPLLKKFEFVDDFTEDGFAAVRYKDPKKGDLWAVIDRDGEYVSFFDPKLKKKEIFRNVPASNAAEVIEQFRHTKAVRTETVEGFASNALFRDARRLALRNGMKAENVAPTNVKGIFTVFADGKKGYVNANTNVALKPKFDEIIAHDAADGFLRVKKDGKWGILDPETGKPFFDFESRGYASIQIQSVKDGLFEVEIPVAGPKGNVVKRGLIDHEGNVRIDPKYDYIESPSPGVYRGVNYEMNGKNFSISEASEFVHVGDGVSTVSHAKFDATSTITTAARNANYLRSANEGIQGLNVRTMSRAVEELRTAGLSRIMRGLDGVHGTKFPSFDDYAQKLGFEPSVAHNSTALFEGYLHDLFSAYRKAYQKEVAPMSKKESFFIETQVLKDYVREFERRASATAPTMGRFSIMPRGYFRTENPANDSQFFQEGLYRSSFQ